MKRIKTFKLFELYNTKTHIKKGDLVIFMREHNRPGLIVSDFYITDDEFEEEVVDVCYRMDRNDIFPIDVNELRKATFEELEDHIWAYVSIAKDNGYIINIPEYYAEEYPEEYKQTKIREELDKFDI